MISAFTSGQTNPAAQTDSVSKKKDTTETKPLNDQMKLDFPSFREQPRLAAPDNKRFRRNPNLALTPNKRPSEFRDPNNRMPVLRPRFRSNMPVMKPDSSVHYHLRIKRIGRQ